MIATRQHEAAKESEEWMANPEHLAILQQGVEAWNAWRQEHPEVQPDLDRADLSGGKLMEADLTKAVLLGVDLFGADLTQADLFGANLAQADLFGADLTQADLFGADLSGADLSGADLSGADLTEAVLFGANLTQAVLTRAVLTRADFTDADLTRAVLQEATLHGADFTRADLTRANLTQADLTRANLTQAILQEASLSGAGLAQAILQEATLSGADLSGADLTEARIDGTLFADVDLRGVQGLDTVQHTAPSTIGIDTLYNSHGDIPEVFLRGCGVPNSMIEYARSLVAAVRPIDYYSCFISYSSQDEPVAQRLHADLQAKGVRCWFAPHNMQIGDSIIDSIDRAIRLHEKLLLILSEASVASAWVGVETKTALMRERNEGRAVLFPIRLDDAVLHSAQGWAAQVQERHIGDFRQWKQHDAYQQAFARLLRDLQAVPS